MALSTFSSIEMGINYTYLPKKNPSHISARRARNCFFIRAKQRNLPNGHGTMCDDLSRWKNFDITGPRQKKNLGPRGKLQTSGKNGPQTENPGRKKDTAHLSQVHGRRVSFSVGTPQCILSILNLTTKSKKTNGHNNPKNDNCPDKPRAISQTAVIFNFYCQTTYQSPTSKQSLQPDKGWNSGMTLRTWVTASASALAWWQAGASWWFTRTARKKNKQQQQTSTAVL